MKLILAQVVCVLPFPTILAFTPSTRIGLSFAGSVPLSLKSWGKILRIDEYNLECTLFFVLGYNF